MEKKYRMAVVNEAGKIDFVEREMRSPSDHEVVIKTKAVGICGGDLHIFRGKHPAAPLPAAIGHELSGEVINIGRSVSEVNIGDRVAMDPVIICGKCYFCKRGKYNLCTQVSYQYRKGQGAFAPFFFAEEDRVHKLASNVSFEDGAVIEPLTVAQHAVRKAGIELGQTALILGAGPIGLLILCLLRASGLEEIYVTDIQDHRLNIAKELGAHVIFKNGNSTTNSVKTVLEHTCGLGVDKVFEAVGRSQTLIQSLQVVKKGGTVVVVSLFEQVENNIPMNTLVEKEISVVGSIGSCWDFRIALRLVERGVVQPRKIISHRMPVTLLQEAFELLCDPTGRVVKVMVTFD
jgi:2-desacetyl-2-hydroxyethyl bacteriochlorophyllide A dehydrogenase